MSHSAVEAEPGRDDELAGKVALVTGGASGIGRAAAVAYARAGANTAVSYYPADSHDVTETLDEVKAAGGQCLAVPVDVRDPEQVDSFAQRTIERYGRLDIAVAAAGIARQAPLPQMDDDTWNDLLSVDLSGIMRTFRAAAARMSGPGAMVAISSIAGAVYGWDSHAHYAAAKAGILGLCRSLTLELSPHDIRVNVVIPGLIETPQTLDAANSLGRANLEHASNIVPWGRVGSADDVARVIRFLTSRDSEYVTGQTIIVDGGLAIRRPD